MASETITRNDLTAILNEVLPSTASWSKLTASGTNTVTVPSSAKEAVVVVRHPTITAISYTFTLTDEMLLENRHYYSGYGWGSSNNAAEISVSNRVVGIANLYNNNTNYTSSANLIVYYR